MSRKKIRKKSGEMHPTPPPPLLRRRCDREATVEPVPLYSPLVAAIMAVTPSSMPPA
jgi:hypothetical protein